MKVVLDSNVIIAGFAARGLCEAVIAACLGHHEIILSEEILVEVGQHLGSKVKLPPDRIREIVSFLREQTTIVKPDSVPADACRDPDDLVILGTAMSARCDFLVTGDSDLLSIHQYQGIPILSPRDFYDQLAGI